MPLAANRAPVDFAIVSFGLAVTVLEEDQEGVALDMYFHHHSAADTAKALELARAGEHVIETGGKEGYEAFDAFRRKYKSEPWSRMCMAISFSSSCRSTRSRSSTRSQSSVSKLRRSATSRCRSCAPPQRWRYRRLLA